MAHKSQLVWPELSTHLPTWAWDTQAPVRHPDRRLTLTAALIGYPVSPLGQIYRQGRELIITGRRKWSTPNILTADVGTLYPQNIRENVINDVLSGIQWREASGSLVGPGC